MTVSNLVLALGLAVLGLAQGAVSLVIAWLILGVGMAIGLYDPAFATLTRLYGRDARAAITGITLIAGFASTVGWPASAWFEAAFGWRAACLIWAGVNLVVAMPLNWLVIPPAAAISRESRVGRAAHTAPPRAAMPILAFYFCATAFVTGAMAAHLPRFLEAAGATPTAAIAAAALVGPAQVGARIVEFSLLRAIHPVWSGRIAVAMHPLAAAALGALGPLGVAPFALLHGAGNGMVTIARGTLPLAIFGPDDYGLRTGILAAPSRVALSAAPFLFGLLLDAAGVKAVLLSAGISLAALASLLLLRPRPVPAAAAAASD